MFIDAARYLAEVVFGLFSLALLLRFYLQLVRAPYRNPLSHFLNALTDFMVKPARRVIPGLWGMDLASLVLAWACEVLLLVVLLMLYGTERSVGMGGVVYVAIFVLALVKLLKMSVYIVMVAVIIQALLSWFNPYSPVAPLLNSLVQPFLRPLRKRIPPIGGVDLTPLVLIVILQLILMLPIRWLETMVRVPV